MSSGLFYKQVTKEIHFHEPFQKNLKYWYTAKPIDKRKAQEALHDRFKRQRMTGLTEKEWTGNTVLEYLVSCLELERT